MFQAQGTEVSKEPKGGLQQDAHRDKVQRQDLGLDW